MMFRAAVVPATVTLELETYATLQQQEMATAFGEFEGAREQYDKVASTASRCFRDLDEVARQWQR